MNDKLPTNGFDKSESKTKLLTKYTSNQPGHSGRISEKSNHVLFLGIDKLNKLIDRYW